MKGWIIFLFLFMHQSIIAECIIEGARTLHDPIFLLLSKERACPKNVFEFSAIFEKSGLTIKPAMVANRGRHNPRLGSFSFFEEITGTSAQLEKPVQRGELLFGHFTELQGTLIDFNQEPSLDNLLIEAIAWDYEKGLYNFYELIGQGQSSQWFYRGDSNDALKDNRYLFLDPPAGEKKFGNIMRCSACHLSGGPIMKELEDPHNDWWTETRPLSFAPNRPSSTLSKHLSRLMEPAEFSVSIKEGMAALESSQNYQRAKAARSLQEQLRPLFCTTEINIVSASTPLSSTKTWLHLPSAYFISPWLGTFEAVVAKSFYEANLINYRMRFPETNLKDADHAWLSLVKGHSDHLAIRSLIEQGVIDETWVKAILSIDIKNPTISALRCQLLKLVPETISADWRGIFQNNLQRSPWPEAQELYTFLQHAPDYAAMAKKYAHEIEQSLASEKDNKNVFEKLLRDRVLINITDLVKNPRGQILEPSFRVIFPVPGNK